MKVTPIVIYAVILDIFMLFGVFYLMPAAPGLGAIGSDHPLSQFVAGNYSDPDSLTIEYQHAPVWANFLSNIPFVGDLVASVVTANFFVGVIASFGILVMGMLTFPFTLAQTYHLPVLFTVLFGAIYYILNIAALVGLLSGRAT
jgi:hypothetical protein